MRLRSTATLAAFLFLSSCARYEAEPGMLGYLLLMLRPRSSNPIGRIYSGLTPMSASSQAISLGGTVEMSRSIVLCYFRTSSSDPSSAPTCTLSDASTIQVDTGATFAGYVVQWYVVEFTSGTSVQRGTTTFAPADTSHDISISAVDTSRAFTLVTARIPDNVLRTTDQQRMVRSRLTSSSNLRLDRQATAPATCGSGPVACDVTVAWQVVELLDANVQSGAFNWTTTSTTVSITPVNTTKAFVLFNASPDAAAAGVEGDYMNTAYLSDSSTLAFARNSATSSLDLSWYVVEMRDDTFVQTGTATDTTFPASPLDTTLPVTINENAAVALVSTNVASAANSDVDITYYTPTYTTGSNLRFTRATTDMAGPAVTLRWQAIQFVAQ